MTPAYLQNQIHQSLANLDLDCIDVYYIHNPESQLGAVSREEFDSRLGLAFAKLEENRATGKIRYYGVATWNGFRADPSGREYHSLERMVELATTVGGTAHGFRFIQLPFNFAMPEALANRNQEVQGEYEALLEAAADLGVNVIASASILQGRVAKGITDDVREPLGSLASDAQTGIQFVRSTPGITTALVGMSRVAHVEENLELVGIPPASLENYARLFN
jgi:aryl-alcohol dehydrogenase-like predicted oxidoreductase